MKAGFPLLVVIFLVVGVGGGAAFGGGVLYGRNSAPQAKSAATSAPAPGSANPVAQGVTATGTPAAGGQAQRGSIGGTAGAIDSLSGNTLTVRTQQGTLTTVNLTADTRLLMTGVATRDDLKTGTTVTVIGGQPDSNGVITANSVTITPPGLNPLAQGTASAGGAGGQRGGSPGPRGTPTRTP